MSRRLNKSIYFTPPSQLPLTSSEEDDNGYTSGDESEYTSDTVRTTVSDDYDSGEGASFESNATVIPNSRPVENDYYLKPIRLTQSARAPEGRRSFDFRDDDDDDSEELRSDSSEGSLFLGDMDLPSEFQSNHNSVNESNQSSDYDRNQRTRNIFDDIYDGNESDASFSTIMRIPKYPRVWSTRPVRKQTRRIFEFSSEQRPGGRSMLGENAELFFQPKKLNFDDTNSTIFSRNACFENRKATESPSAILVNKFKRSPASDPSERSDASTFSASTNSIQNHLTEVQPCVRDSSCSDATKRSIESLSTQTRNAINKAGSTQAANINCILVEPVAVVSKQHVEMSSRSNRASIIYEIFIYSAMQKSIHENPVEAEKLLYEAKPAFSNGSELTNNGQVLVDTKHSVRVGSGVIYIKRVTTVTEGMRDHKYKSTDAREYSRICKGGIKAAVQRANIDALLNVASDHDFTKDANGDISEVETISLIFGNNRDKNLRELEPFISSTCKDSSSQSPIFYDEHIQLGRQSVIIKRVTKLTGEKIAGAGLDKIWEKKVDFGITEDRYYQRNPETTIDTDATSPHSGAVKTNRSTSVCSTIQQNKRRSHRMKDKSKLGQPRTASSCSGSTKSPNTASTMERGIRERSQSAISISDNTVNNVSSLCSVSSSAESPKTAVICVAKKCTNRGIHWYMRDVEAPVQTGLRKRSFSVDSTTSNASVASSKRSNLSISGTSLSGSAYTSSPANTNTVSTFRSTSTAIEPIATSTPSAKPLDAAVVDQVRRTMTELSPIPLRNTQSDTVLANAYTSKVAEAVFRGEQPVAKPEVVHHVGASGNELDQLKAVIDKCRKKKPPTVVTEQKSEAMLPPQNMDPQMLACTVDITEPMTRVAAMNHMFYHHRRVRLCFMANNVSMAVNLVMTVRSDEQDLKLEPVEMYIDNERVWRRSARIAATKKGNTETKESKSGSKEGTDSDGEKPRKDAKLSKEEAMKPVPVPKAPSVSSTGSTSATNVTLSPSTTNTSAVTSSTSRGSIISDVGKHNRKSS